MKSFLRRLYLAFLLTFFSGYLWAIERVVIGNWIVQTSPGSIEASTSAGSTSFGIYCQADQCMFYLHDSLRCHPGSKSPILMSGLGNAASLNMQCAQINGVLFQILEPFNVVLDEVKRGGLVSFAVPLQNGSFGVSRYSLNGGFEAVRKALQEAGNAKRTLPKPVDPLPAQPLQPVPGSRRLQDIMI
ncbi:hypothetical protein [Polynucleobacter sp. MWH-Jannik1A5]|uniref:hypothetical protein n=1 Tax=Polynucleobacter sp. MWH-Jannik1A5 TaxID=1855890 RepID=UPI001C0B3670|nr:hypothetical protein [Polynucleobacter sp. MWH-Jannik1A5]MBU3547276.1 hypothetical protein [Polynucleobacter sp. MWH-Jannik1A5]